MVCNLNISKEKGNKTMKRITISIITTMYLASTGVANAGMWDTSKEYMNAGMFWKSNHLEDIDFGHIYPKEFYKKSYFGFVMIGASIIASIALSPFTFGAGVPAGAIGASWVASWVAGGGAGSYMAGLSIIGGWFGGNAILGAAILNGISLATIGGSTATSLTVFAKIGIAASITSIGLDGVVYFKNPETDKLEYKVKVSIPENLGSKATRQLVDKLYDIEEDINEALEDGNDTEQERLFGLKEQYNKEALSLLGSNIHKDDNQEDLLVLGVIAWNSSNYPLFNEAISKINASQLDNTGFLNYLYALQSLSSGNTEQALAHLDNSKDEDKYALEPILLYINVLGNENFIKNESKIESLVQFAEENFDSDKYATGYSMVGIYYRAATFYFVNKRFVKAEEYYKKAFDELGLLQKYFFGKQLKHTIQLALANSLYAQRKIETANGVYQGIIDDIDDQNSHEANNTKQYYLGNKK